MNHIVRLQTDLAAAQAEIDAKADAIQEFRAHLAGSKFAGVGSDGSRKDWIATRDVYAWLTHISAAGA
jgi:hypothetical protein